jgi:hypothetical protein
MTEKQKKWSQIEKIMYIKSVTFKRWFKCYSFDSHSPSELMVVNSQNMWIPQREPRRMRELPRQALGTPRAVIWQFF